MAKKKKTVVSLKEKLQEQVQSLKAKVLEMKEATENPKADAPLRETHKKLKRLQRKLARMVAMEKRAEAKAPKPEEPPAEDPKGKGESKPGESQEAS